MSHPAETPTTPALVRGHLTVGDFDLTILTDGTYLLDGGAMFGVVPKTLWAKRAPANAQNQILLGTNTVVARTGKHTVVIETGIGNKLPDRLRSIYDSKQLLPESFRAAGIRPEEVDIVINSHLHFDHCGWNTTKLEDGRIVPTFPNARYFAHRGEVAVGKPGDVQSRALARDPARGDHFLHLAPHRFLGDAEGLGDRADVDAEAGQDRPLVPGRIRRLHRPELRVLGGPERDHRQHQELVRVAAAKRGNRVRSGCSTSLISDSARSL